MRGPYTEPARPGAVQNVFVLRFETEDDAVAAVGVALPWPERGLNLAVAGGLADHAITQG